MSLNYCCHDDYTNTGGINAFDVNILLAYQLYLVAKSAPPPDIPTFVDFYNTQAGAKAVPELGSVTIESLPTMDCADYTETGSVNAFDVNILLAYQLYLVAKSTPPPDVATFVDFYNTQAGAKAVPELGSVLIKHLPILEADTQVITDGGLVDKCDTSALCTCSAVVEDTVLKVDFDATTLSETPLVGSAIDGRIKGVEIVFNNVTFTSGETGNGLSVTPETPFTDGFKDTQNADTLNFYYDYSIRSTSVNNIATEPNKTKSVIGFIDTTQNGTGKTKAEVGALTFSVDSGNFSITSGDTPTISDVRVYDSSAEVAQYNITRCGE